MARRRDQSAAAGDRRARPGLVTATGLDTFVDPRHGGGKFTPSATEDLVELLALDGREYLRYKPFPVDVAIVRGDSIDPSGNVTCSGEAAQLDALAVAQAAKACGGRVIVQVKNLLDRPIDPRLVHIPAVLVDDVVHAPAQWQTYAGEFDPELSGDAANAGFDATDHDPIRMLIARRAAAEVRDGDVLNVGFGVSALVVDALAEQDRLDDVTLAIEQGLIDGIPVSGDLFGAARGPKVVHSSTTQFDLFSGGLLDVSCLGMAEVDVTGAVNVSKIGGGIVGPGGFIDISQNSPRVVFCGTFTARGLDIEIVGGELVIRREGRCRSSSTASTRSPTPALSPSVRDARRCTSPNAPSSCSPGTASNSPRSLPESTSIGTFFRTWDSVRSSRTHA